MSRTHLVQDMKTDEGQGLTEYGLILVLIAVAAVVATQLLGSQLSDFYTSIVNSF